MYSQLRNWLDAARSLAYGLVLAYLLLPLRQPNIGMTHRLVYIAVFLTVDGLARLVNRRQIAEEIQARPSTEQRARALLGYTWCLLPLFLAETVGLIYFAFAAGSYLTSSAFGPDAQRGLSIFALLAFVHNGVHLYLLWGREIWQYPFGVLLKDALEVPGSRIWIARWQEILGLLERKIAAEIAKFKARASIVAAIKYLIWCFSAWVLRTLLHILLQYCAIHILWSNLTIGAFLLVASYYLEMTFALVSVAGRGIVPRNASALVIASAVAALLGYLVTSLMELDRVDLFAGRVNRKSTAKHPLEDTCQRLGNCFLVLTLVGILALTRVSSLSVALLRVQMLAMLVMLIGSLPFTARQSSEQK